MFTYFVSAKTGDNVNTAFYRVAADLAGVGLSRPDLEVATRVVKAEIVDHPTTSPPGAAAGTAPQEGDKPEEVGGKKKCVVQ